MLYEGLYKDVRANCKIYHRKHSQYDRAYESYRDHRIACKWDNPDTLDYDEAKRLIRFVNKWGCHVRYEKDGKDNVQLILNGLKSQVSKLNSFKGKT